MTVPYLFETKCQKIGNYVFLMEKDKSGKFIDFTYREVRGLVHSFARALRSLGVKKGSLVGLLSDNRSAWMVSDLAIMSLGAADVPRGRDSTAGEVEFIYKTTEVENVIVENLDQLKKLLSVKKNLECLKNIIVLDEDRVGDISTLEAEYGVKIFTYNELINKFKCDEDAELVSIIMNSKDDDLATVIFTSGTTGEPKGVMLTQGNFDGIIKYIDSVSFPTAPQQRWLSVLPVWHSFERILQYIIIYLDSTIAYSKPIGKILLGDLKRINPHFMGSVPRIWESVKSAVYAQMKKEGGFKKKVFDFFVFIAMKHYKYSNRFHGLERRYEKRHRVLEVLTAALPLLLLKPLYMLGDKLVYSQIKTKLGSNFTCGISGGGSLSPMIDDFFNAIGINLVDGYGLTETAPVIGIRTWKKRRPGTMVPYGNVDIKIISLEDGHLCKIGEKGELHVKGEQVMKGYYKRPEFTAKVIDTDGYFNTGDLAVWTIDNEYNIVGRSKDTIVLSGGENLEPVPIEAALNESEYIEASVVVGQDQKYLGALIVPAIQAIEYYLKQNKIYYVSRDDIYTLPEVHSLIENEIRERVSSKTGFKSFEQIYKFALLRKSFEINNELSSKQEIKRFKIAQLYEKEIKEMFV
ncbi:long-chain fatty acid--CoA ligase [Spirochaetales bacterium NM-380-WT-3C1]|uniref:Long-chain fatty acid--CoA ligase n=1 Tax=Bullifex porci TaxID=2606638 RepID=A0A7X2TR92_9SPIO|nr:long-chain fatty acid--CoA ligase [Bullifex porci]MSU05738.1 long-chain fatty acid--CoA ligase [Bullifex porci]